MPRDEKQKYTYDITPPMNLPLSPKDFVHSSDLLPVTKQVEEDSSSNLSLQIHKKSISALKDDELDTFNKIIAQPLSFISQQRLAGQHGPIEAKRFIYSVNYNI